MIPFSDVSRRPLNFPIVIVLIIAANAGEPFCCLALREAARAAWLLLQENYHYLADELAFIPEHTLECQGFSRPLNLKPTSRSLFPGLFEAVGEDKRLLISSTRVLTPAR
jgi:hypothetical protein